MINSTSQPTRISISVQKWLSKNHLSINSLILTSGLVAFELFNFTTTDFALRDLLGEMRILGVLWATILALAFCGIDFAGITKLFVSDDQSLDQKENWLLFGAWLLSGTMNALLTWWGVAISLSNHALKSTAIVDSATIVQVVPIFVAVMVWLTRILLIGSFSLKGKGRALSTSRVLHESPSRMNRNTTRPASVQPVQMHKSSFKGSTHKTQNRILNYPEPEYISEPSQTHTNPSYAAQNQPKTNSRRF